MKRDVYHKIGGLDERFGLGLFDDDDLAERARRAGFELVVAEDLFVHHFGSRTFQGDGVDAEKLLDENSRRFADKWGLKKHDAKPVPLRPWRPSSSFLSWAQRAFAQQVDEPGQKSSGSPEPGPRQRSGTLHTLTRSASEGMPACGVRSSRRRWFVFR